VPFLLGTKGSKDFRCRMSEVKFDFSTVRTRVIPILKRVEVEDYPPKIGRVYGWSRQHVCYYLRKLEKCGLVKRGVRSRAVFYQLTGRGKTFLASCEAVVFGSGVYRLDRCQVRFEIVSEGCLPVDFRRVEMVNWTALLDLELGVKVRHTSRSWIVHVETLYGKHPGELFVLAKNLADRVAKSLMLKYGCRLADGEICRGYELKVDDPVAKLLVRYFCVSTPERKIDHSPDVSQGELEHFSRDVAIEYLLMPERVKKLEDQVQVLHFDLEELTGALKKILEVDGFGQPVPESQKSMQEYVS
jgi:hypothetical protein